MTAVTGGCHCGAVRFEAEVDTSSGIECNCSYCSKAAPILSACVGEKLNVVTGEDALTDYRFNKRVIAHLFCRHCGIGPFGRGKGRDGKPMAMVNLRCVDDIDLASVERNPFNGAAL